MSEILFNLVEKTNPNDPRMCAMCHKRGDAIHVAEDGHGWGERDLANVAEGRWLLLKLRLVSESEASVFLTPGRAGPGSGKLGTLHAFYLDADGLPDDPSAMTFADLDKLKCPRTKPDDPRHFGPTLREFG